jgi:hypothetical protein
MVMLNSPQNPTGGVIPPPTDVEAIAEMVRDRDLMVLSDEIYSRIVYGGPPVSIAASRACSKDHHPGRLLQDLRHDRLAHGLRRDAAWLVDAVNKLMVNSNSCTASFTQRAGIAALTGPQDESAHGGRVPPPPGRLLRRAEHDARLPLRPSREAPSTPSPTSRHRHGLQGTGRLAARGSRSRLPERRGLREPSATATSGSATPTPTRT